MMEKIHHPFIFARHKRHHGNKLCLYISRSKIKTRVHSRLSDCSLAQIMRIEGPEIDAVEFEERLEICKEHNHSILL